MFINSWLAAAFAFLTSTPVLLRDDQTLLSPRSNWKRHVKKAILPILYRNVNGLYVGESNRDFFTEYGTPRTFLFRYCIDNELFRKAYHTLKTGRQDCRKKFGIETASPTILFSGKLVDKKKPQVLLEAFSIVRKEMACNLLFVGDGPLRSELEKTVSAQSIPDVHFAGFLNQTELPAAYTAADIFVLPSSYQETWGLVVNEAMNFDLPIIVSDRVGCARDLVREGENGYVFRADDVKALAETIAHLVKSPEERLRYGLRSSQIISEYTAEACAQQLVHACLSVTSAPAFETSEPRTSH
jgi:glycosyltransferase involved in cell wall biosynthesis